MNLEQYIEDLSHEDLFVRIQAGKALKLLGDDKAVGPLIGALEDENPGVRIQAADSLESITGQKLGEDAEAWRKWYASKGKGG
jgi:HEAT repeat protein